MEIMINNEFNAIDAETRKLREYREFDLIGVAIKEILDGGSFTRSKGNAEQFFDKFRVYLDSAGYSFDGYVSAVGLTKKEFIHSQTEAGLGKYLMNL